MAIDRQAALLVAASLAGAAALAGVTVVSMQLACALVLVGAVLALFASSRTTGLIALWMLWLVAPLIRRVFGLIDGYISADPLALAPFVATAGVAVLQLTRVGLSRRVTMVLSVALFGLALGVPAAVSEPRAGIFALAAYGSAVLCIVLGYGEGAASGSGFTLRRALFVAAPLIAIYGILQYFLPLAEWDKRWLSTVDLASIGAPEEDRIRVFSTLNSPATLAVVLAIAVLFAMSVGRLSAGRVGMIALLMTALGLTFVRSAVVGLVGGLVGLAVATRGRASARIVVLLLATAVPVLALSAVSPTGQAIVDRVTTLGALEDDVSADARLEKPLELLPGAISRPVGHGLGSAGEATKLRDSGGLRSTDNGYLAMIWQLGPVGFLLFVGSGVAAVAMLARTRPGVGDHRELKGLLMSGLVLLLVLAFGGDIFYGASGAIFWYIVGKALWLADRAPATRPAEVARVVSASLPSRANARVPAGAVSARAGSSSRPLDAPGRQSRTDPAPAGLPPAVTLPAVPWATSASAGGRRPPNVPLAAAVVVAASVLAGLALASVLFSGGGGDTSSATGSRSSPGDARAPAVPSPGTKIAGPSTPAAGLLSQANRRRASNRRARERLARERRAARRRARARAARAEIRSRNAATARARSAEAARARRVPATARDVTPRAPRSAAPPPPPPPPPPAVAAPPRRPAGVTPRPPPPPSQGATFDDSG